MAKHKRTPTPPSVSMELIKPENKRRARITSIAAKNTSSHYRHKIEVGNERVDDKIDD